MKSIELLLTLLPKNTDSLTEEEQILFNLIEFFKDPEGVKFDLSNLLKLDTQNLILATKAIHTYFSEDSYTLQGTQLLFLDKKNPLINQAKFVSLLQQYGFNFDDKKLSVYYKRGKLPKIDLEIQGKPYWFESTALKFIKSNSGSLSYGD